MSDEQPRPVAWMHPHKPDIITLSHVDGYLPLHLRAAPKVKELVWVDGWAHSIVGDFELMRFDGTFWVTLHADSQQYCSEHHLSEHKAKAAAQAWYNAKILGALE